MSFLACKLFSLRILELASLFLQAEANIDPEALAQKWYSFKTSQKGEKGILCVGYLEVLLLVNICHNF